MCGESAKLERKSLEVHSQYFRDSCATVEPIEYRERVLAVLEEAYMPVKSKVPVDLISYSNFRRVLCRLEMQSSPGYPYFQEAPTIGDWLKFDGISHDNFQVDRLWHHVCQLLDGDQEMVFTVFIKEEPHSVAKQEDGRFRLILASPLHFQVLWQMIFGFQNDMEIKNSFSIPSQQGIILPLGNWKLYRELWVSRGYDIGLDKRSWDWTVSWWKLCWELELRKSLLFGDVKLWSYHAERLYKLAFMNPILLLSDGLMLRQLYPGIMKSGLVNTISTNSHCQLIDHVLVCLMEERDYRPLPVAVGDDTLQAAGQLVSLETYKSIGVVVKSASDGLEFVGHEFLSTGPVPLYLEKHLCAARFVSSDRELMIQYFDSMCRLYANSPLFQFWYDVAESLGLAESLHSHRYYWIWYNYDVLG